MDKLTIEEKAKAYDEAIKRVENIKTGKCKTTFMFTEGLFEHIFPELKESEDEKIKQELIEYHKIQAFLDGKPNNKHVKFVAWLEKQGEQKPIKVPKFKVGDFIQFNGMGHTRYTVKEVCGLSHYINTCNKRMDMSYTDANFELVEQKPAVIIPKFRVGDTIRIKNSDAEYTITEISDGYYRGKGWCLDIAAGDKCGDYELIEQKPAWSEEDENHVKSILSTIECCKAQFPNAQAVVEAYNADIEWFKNLKDRVQPQPHWKPSGEQMDALYTYIYNPQYFNSSDPRMELVESVYKDLKKLREE